MPDPLYIFRDPPCDGPTNMARDEHLLFSLTHRPAALRLYSWEPPTLSLGCFQRHAELNRLPAELRALAVVRRPTGGGAILHDREMTYGLAINDDRPPLDTSPAELYRLVHRCWQAALEPDVTDLVLAPDDFPPPNPRRGPFFCFEKPGRTDLLRGDQKILGSAQRRVTGRILQHGSLLLGRRFTSHPGGHLDDPAPAKVEHWIDAFVTSLAAALDLQPQPDAWTPDQLADVTQRRQRYASDEWTGRH